MLDPEHVEVVAERRRRVQLPAGRGHHLQLVAAAQVVGALRLALDELEHEQRVLRHVVDHLRADARLGRRDAVQVLVLAVDREQPRVLRRDAHHVRAVAGDDLVVGIREPARELGHGALAGQRRNHVEQLSKRRIFGHLKPPRSVVGPPTIVTADAAAAGKRGRDRRRRDRLQRCLSPGRGGRPRRAPDREGRAHQRLHVPRRGARHPVQPVAVDDGVPPLQRRALQPARRVRRHRQPAHRVDPREPGRAAPRRQPGARHRARRRGDRPGGGRCAHAGRDGRVAARRGVDRERRLRRPPHGHLRAREGGARPRRGHPHPHARDRDRARPRTPRRGGHDRGGPDRDGAGRERLRDVGAAGGGDGGSLRAVRPRRPPAHRPARGLGPRARPRHALLPRHRPPGLRAVGGGRRPLRRVRAEPGRALGGRRAVGSRRDDASGRPRAVRPADGGCRAAVPVPRRRRRGRARVPSRRDDTRRQPAARPDARRARVLDGGRALAERVRRRRRDRQDHRRVGHGGRDRVGRARLPGLALRRGAPPSGRAGGRRARDLQVLLPPPLPAGHLGVGPARPHLAAARRTQDLGAVYGAKNGWSGPTTTGRGSRGGGRARTSAPTAGRGRPSSAASARSTRRSASGSASST